MTLQDLMRAIDHLSADELRILREYIDERKRQTHPARGKTPQERAQRLQAAAAAIREGLTAEQLAEMTAAMNNKSPKR